MSENQFSGPNHNCHLALVEEDLAAHQTLPALRATVDTTVQILGEVEDVLAQFEGLLASCRAELAACRGELGEIVAPELDRRVESARRRALRSWRRRHDLNEGSR